MVLSIYFPARTIYSPYLPLFARTVRGQGGKHLVCRACIRTAQAASIRLESSVEGSTRAYQPVNSPTMLGHLPQAEEGACAMGTVKHSVGLLPLQLPSARKERLAAITTNDDAHGWTRRIKTRFASVDWICQHIGLLDHVPSA